MANKLNTALAQTGANRRATARETGKGFVSRRIPLWKNTMHEGKTGLTRQETAPEPRSQKTRFSESGGRAAGARPGLR